MSNQRRLPASWPAEEAWALPTRTSASTLPGGRTFLRRDLLRNQVFLAARERDGAQRKVNAGPWPSCAVRLSGLTAKRRYAWKHVGPKLVLLRTVGGGGSRNVDAGMAEIGAVLPRVPHGCQGHVQTSATFTVRIRSCGHVQTTPRGNAPPHRRTVVCRAIWSQRRVQDLFTADFLPGEGPKRLGKEPRTDGKLQNLRAGKRSQPVRKGWRKSWRPLTA